MPPNKKLAIKESDTSTLDIRTDFDSETPSKHPRKSILKTNRVIKSPISRKKTNCINSELSVDDSDDLEYNSNGFNSPSTSQSVKMSSPESRHVSDVSPIKKLAVEDSEKSTVDFRTICFISSDERGVANSSQSSVRKYFHYSNPFNSPSKSVQKSSTKTNSVKNTPVSRKKTPVSSKKTPVSRKKTQVCQKNVTSLKIKRVPFIDSDMLEFDFNAYIESASESMKCTQEIDLFGEPVPLSTCVKKLEPETKCVKKTPIKKTPVKKTSVKKTPVKKTPVKKTPVKKNKKQIPENFVVHTNDNLDVSGIQVLPDSPALNTNEKSATDIRSKPAIDISDLKCLPESLTAVKDTKLINKLINVKCDPKLDVSGDQHLSTSNPKKKSATKIKFDPKVDMSGVDYLLSRPFLTSSDEDSDEELTIFEGVIAFADYRRNSKDYSSSVHWKLRRLGAKVEKTFTDKVTHVIFHQGYRRTFTTAIKRNVPLVSLLWLEYSRRTQTLLDPAEYPPRNMEKYVNPPQKKKYKNYQKVNKQLYSFVTPEDFRRAEIFESEHFEETDPSKDEHEQSKCLIDILSTKLHQTLSVDDGHEVKTASISNRPIPIRILRKWLTPRGIKYKERTALNDDIIKYENYFKLNSIERKRFRKHLYPADRYLNNIKNMKLDDSIDIQSIACTGLTKGEIDIIKNYVQNLGKFVFHTEVEHSTTYVVTKSQPNRTLNMVLAMAFGCFIISEEWVLKSHEIGRWLPYQQYLISDLSEAVKEFQTRRQEAGTWLTFHIFDDAGYIFISDTCEIPATKLKQLVESCGGNYTCVKSSSTVIVGHTPDTPQMNKNVSEKWVLDCISQGKLLDTNQYRLVNNNMT